jgi:Xaa-Pro aminopeptidase
MSHLEVYAEAMHAMYVAGGETPALNQAVIPGMPRDGARVMHLPPTRRQIRAGEPFALDLCGVYKRYHTNVARTFFWGDPSPELLRVSEISKGAFDVLTGTAKAGVPIARVNRAVREYYRDENWDGRGFYGGYELGIAFPPDWVGEFLFTYSEEGPEGEFQANMVTNFEAMLERIVAPQTQLLGCNIDTVVYEENGARRLSAISPDLIVLG